MSISTRISYDLVGGEDSEGDKVMCYVAGPRLGKFGFKTVDTPAQVLEMSGVLVVFAEQLSHPLAAWQIAQFDKNHVVVLDTSLGMVTLRPGGHCAKDDPNFLFTMRLEGTYDDVRDGNRPFLRVDVRGSFASTEHYRRLLTDDPTKQTPAAKLCKELAEKMSELFTITDVTLNEAIKPTKSNKQ